MIRVLPPEVVNQIAAGEVVERPFSVVKELLENSLDAGATRVHVALAEGGRALMRITDDGCGFSPADLELAFVSHATSKLGSLADLDHIASLGFRGEALASIGSIARVSIRSRAAGSDSGHEIRCEGGAVESVRPSACPPGTVIEVRDLFFNTPARRRFLKTPRAERARIQDLVLRLALARPDVDFTLEVDGKEALRLPSGEGLEARIGRALGRSVAGGLYPVEQQWEEYRVLGFAGDPDLARRDSTQELLYINGRLARDKAAGYAIRQAYREFLMGGRFPVYVLMLSLPPQDVDVNVHPTKSEVRFLDGRRVCGLLHDAVRAGLAMRGADDLRTEGERENDAAGAGGARADSPRAYTRVDRSKPGASTGFPSLSASLFDAGDRKGGDPRQGAAPTTGALPGVQQPAAAEAGGHVAEAKSRVGDRVNPFRAFVESRDFLQIADLYVVFEGEDGGMVVVDQHALHERVMYERLVAQHEARDEVASQQLLVPQVVELSPGDKAYLLDAQEALAAEGLVLDDFGGDSIAIHAVPAVLDRVKPAALVDSFLHGETHGKASARADGEGGAERPSAADAIRERFHSMACRAAIMSGDKLSMDEMRALLVEASELEHPHNCPHGRPTVLRFSPPELERFFRRRV